MGNFRSPDSQFVMVAYGSHNALGDALEDCYQAILQDTTAASRNVTYNVLRDSFFVISGQEGSHIFYTKTLLHNDVFKVLDLTYDAALQD